MKKFYQKVTSERRDGAYAILLDNRAIKTPMKADFSVQSASLASAIREEWQNQGDDIDPGKMPLTGLSNAAIDQIAPAMEATRADLVRFLTTDYLCYLGEEPALVARQKEVWTPYHTWFEGVTGEKLALTQGIMPVDQPPKLLVSYENQLLGLSAFDLTGLKEATSLLGSAILGLALYQGFKDRTAIWLASDLDRLIQKDRWGEDAEAEAVANRRRQDFEDACVFLDHLRAAGSSIP